MPREVSAGTWGSGLRIRNGECLKHADGNRVGVAPGNPEQGAARELGNLVVGSRGLAEGRRPGAKVGVEAR